MMTDNTDLELDLSGLHCPMPLLKTKQALNRMGTGMTIRVIATDPGSERDFQVFSRQSGIELVRFERHGDQFIYWLRKP
jgi:tRNA 2-thiouridine synthesizing protein A